MKLLQSLRSSFLAFLVGVASAGLISLPARAGDHNDAPTTAKDSSADIADLFAFLDPTDITQVVLIATVHPFIVPGQMTEAAAFDENVRYRFEIYNDHVNVASPVLIDGQTMASKKAYIARVKPKLTIDAAFGKRVVGPDPQAGTSGFIPTNLRRPKLQTASLDFQGFKDSVGHNLINKGKYPATSAPLLTVTPINLSTPAPAFNPQSITVAPGETVQFFAGVADDPYFFDFPAFNSFIDGLRNNVGPNVAAFSRMRDTFAGYNVLAIALRIPVVLLQGTNGPKIGVDFLTQRHALERFSSKGLKASGGLVTVDRMGHPLVNSLFIPFDRRDRYNASKPKADASLTFLDTIEQTMSDLGVVVNPPSTAYTALTDLFVVKGDLLQLDTSISNSGSPAGVGYPNGRRVQDDTVDTLLTTINNGNAISDGVANSGAALSSSFPFLGKPNQPLPNGATDPTQN